MHDAPSVRNSPRRCPSWCETDHDRDERDPHDGEPLAVELADGGLLLCRLTQPIGGERAVEVLDELGALLTLAPKAAGQLASVLLRLSL